MKLRVKWAHVYRWYESVEPFLNISLPLEDCPAGERILVLAPHIDDETIGCGGSILRHSSSGSKVTVLYLADCTPERIREADAASSVLGISEKIFWKYQSKTLSQFPEIEQRLADLVNSVNPEIVYLPSFIDRHQDHVALNGYFYKALSLIKKDFMIYTFEVWTTLIPNVVVDISNVIDWKKKALGCYSSQLESHNWLEGTIALNRYRGMIANAKSHGEAFFRMTPHRFKKLWEDIYG
ncbi:MAG: PIG-L family deacetylase [Nitrospirae bacterium]|nr:PIG-L family deacetylase [Nitrospirota bacterium]MBI3593570.1 PIG-L family deacetylase [Nitrospirota bacterium]